MQDIAWTRGGTLSINTVTGGTGLVNVSYGYNTANNIAWRDDVQADDSAVTNQEQTYSYDTIERLTGYVQGTFTANTHSISTANTAASNSWSLDSEGNRYNNSGTASGIDYGTTYNAANQSQSSGTVFSPAGNTTTVTFDSSQLLTVEYDSWGRVVETTPVPSGSGGPNGSASYTTYTYERAGPADRDEQLHEHKHPDFGDADLFRRHESDRGADAGQQHAAGDVRLVAARRPVDPPRRRGCTTRSVHGVEHYGYKFGRHDPAALSADGRAGEHRGPGRSDGGGRGARDVHGGRAAAVRQRQLESAHDDLGPDRVRQHVGLELVLSRPAMGADAGGQSGASQLLALVRAERERVGRVVRSDPCHDPAAEPGQLRPSANESVRADDVREVRRDGSAGDGRDSGRNSRGRGH